MQRFILKPRLIGIGAAVSFPAQGLLIRADPIAIVNFVVIAVYLYFLLKLIRLRQACTSYHPATVVLDPWQAIGLAQRLRRKRIRVEEYTFSAASVGRLATTIHLLLREQRLALPPNQELLDELANVRLKESSPGVYRMDHDPDKHDDQAIALALAANHLITMPPKRNWAAY